MGMSSTGSVSNPLVQLSGSPSGSPTDSSSNTNPTEANRMNLGKDDFLKLFITQLQYQDPMSPMDSNQMMQQMASMTTVEQMSNMSSTVSKLSDALVGSQIVQGASMLGKSVVANDGNGGSITGSVDKVSLNNGIIDLLVNGQTVQLGQVKEVDPSN